LFLSSNAQCSFASKDRYFNYLLKELRENPDLSFVAIHKGKDIVYIQADINDDEAMLEVLRMIT